MRPVPFALALLAATALSAQADDSVAGLLLRLQEWDEDGDRVLGLREFYRALSRTLADQPALNLSPGALQALFDEIDVGGRGKLAFAALDEWFDAAQVRLRLALRRVHEGADA